MQRDIDITLLRAFIAVVDTGSVTSAARLLNRTQAAVSLQIKRLEQLLGQQLFEREHRKLRLAPIGELLVASAQRMVSLNDDLWGRMTTPSFEGEIRFGVPADIIPTYIPPILRRFHCSWPRVRVTLVVKNSSELLEDLAAGTTDVALTTDGECVKHAQTLRVDRLVWVGAKDGEAHLRSPLPVCLGNATCRFRPVILDALREAGRDWRAVLEISNQEVVNATISAGVAVGAMLRDSVPNQLEVLDENSDLPPLPEFLINLSLPPTGGSDIAVEFARHIRAEFAQRFRPYVETATSPDKNLVQASFRPVPARREATRRSLARMSGRPAPPARA
jgi:DNA-binding transcriptional LysR family regulator